MTKDQARRMVAKMKKEGSTVASIYEGYSGRGMYGCTTYGVVCGRYDWHFDQKKNRAGYSWDNMGLDMIIY